MTLRPSQVTFASTYYDSSENGLDKKHNTKKKACGRLHSCTIPKDSGLVLKRVSYVTNFLEETKNEQTGTDEDITYEESSYTSEDTDSVTSPKFNELDCGEPFRSQHLTIDFTPIPGLDDTPELSKKCSDFWNLIHSKPELKRFMAFPEETDVSISNTNVLEKPKEECTAVKWIQNRGVVNTALFPNVTRRGCDTSPVASAPSTDELQNLCAQMEQFDQKARYTSMVPDVSPSLSANDFKFSCHSPI